MTRQPDPDRVVVFDTTMRDGEQAPGINLRPITKVAIAAQLERLGVDVIEAGFPCASPGDFDGVRAVASTVTRPTVAALARAVPADIDTAAAALRPAWHPRIHTFIATSDIHMRHKLRMTPDEVLAATEAAVTRARGQVDDVEFSAEDATRSDPEFLRDVYTRAIAAGASTCNVPDTVGYALPHQFAALVEWLVREVPGADRVTWSVHCHDDLGVSVACSLSGVQAGARQIEVAVNGIGERAGNCALEEVVVALRTHARSMGVDTGVDTEQIARTAHLVSERTGYHIPRNKAIVGANAFAHESGIHQHGVLTHRETYEHLDPTALGLRGSVIVLGKHSGRHAVADALRRLGHQLTGEQFEHAFAEFKTVADAQGEVNDADLAAIGARAAAVTGAATTAHTATAAVPPYTTTGAQGAPTRV
ncbi:MAG TPA: 2-isopropylmalate synthase [Micromonosporaceae bacterium]